ncbi:MAG: AAA family ATPase [bacterium]|nr:AAA family ATPase [bacterium]
MKRLEIRLLGGFEAKLTDRPVQRFESQKVRALLAYLALHRDRSLNRDHLAGLFWPERTDEASRRNLRQALYNIRIALGNDDENVAALDTDQSQVRLNPDLECWIDVVEFKDRIRRGLSESGADPLHLREAVRLYKGDLLAGFFLRGCVEFEEWLVTRQEQTREEALQAFRELVRAYLARGEHRFGIQYAKRLLAIDPLSEETHQQLMRLYTMAGRRNRALAQYEQLLNLLQTELGVDPVEDTTDLYRSILLQSGADEETTDREESTPPIIPLIGRGDHFDILQASWSRVIDGQGQFSVVTGESGVGKSRLVKSFVDSASSMRNAVVLRGRSYASAPLVAYRPIAEAIRSVFVDLLADEPEGASRLEPQVLADLALLCPELPKLTATTLDIEINPGLGRTERLAASFLELIDVLLQPAQGETRPIIFLLEDVQWADEATLALLDFLAKNLASRSIWVLATSRDSDKIAESLAALGDSGVGIPLTRLDSKQVEEIAKSLVDLASAPVLADYLWRSGQGLPLAIAELVNLLWDEKILIQLAPGHWALRADPGAIEPPEEIGELINRRFQGLPNSARRLISLAAILGHQFDVEVLTRAADEHLTVVETAIELSLERWLIRQFPQSWAQAGPERDIVLWAHGARRGFFEFAHRAIRSSILDHINPLRRGFMHGEAARALLRRHSADPGFVSEELAFHLLESGNEAEALPWLEHSAEKAARSGAEAIERFYAESAKTVRKRSAKGGAKRDRRHRIVTMRRESPPRE